MSVMICADNWIDSDSAISVTATSAASGFPASNLWDESRRHKKWRSANYFGLNSNIVWQESTGVNITENITGDDLTDLLNQIQTALNTTGASTYTVTTDNGRIKITSDGSGGGGIFSLMTSNAGFTAASALGFSTASDRTGALTYTADATRIASVERFTIDLGLTGNPKALIMVNDRNQPIPIVPNAAMVLEGNLTDVWTSPSYSQALTYDENAIVQASVTGLHSEGLRHWRINLYDIENPTGYTELSKVYLGDAFVPSRGGVEFPFETETLDFSQVVTVEGGHLYSENRPKTAQWGFRYVGLNKADHEELMNIWERKGKVTPFFVIFDPEAAMYSTVGKSVKYVRFVSEPRATLVSPNNYTVSVQVREEI